MLIMGIASCCIKNFINIQCLLSLVTGFDSKFILLGISIATVLAFASCLYG